MNLPICFKLGAESHFSVEQMIVPKILCEVKKTIKNEIF